MSVETERKVTAQAKAALVGKKVVRVGYMSASEAAEAGWSHRPLLVQLDDGSVLYATCDEAENDGCALIVQTPERDVCLGRLPC